MKITCSILCYNYGRYLAEAINSCLDQKPGDYELEILVIDDGSTDETPEICQQYQDSIRVIRSENQGFGATLNRCILEASGDYVCLLDADDYFEREKIVTILPEIQKGYLYIEHCQQYINRDGKLRDSSVYRGGNTSTLCVNRSAALTLLPVGDNEIFFHPLKSAGHGVAIAKPLTFYRLHDTSMTDRKQPGVQHRYLARVTHALADKLLLMAQAGSCSWADSFMLNKISSEYRAIAFYDEMEAALEQRQRSKTLLACLRILLAAVRSQTGLTAWHCKVIARGILMKPLYPEKCRSGSNN